VRSYLAAASVLLVPGGIPVLLVVLTCALVARRFRS